MDLFSYVEGDPVGPWTLDADELMPYKAEEWIHLFRQARAFRRYVLLVEQDRRDAYLDNSLAFVTSKGRK